MSQSYDWACIRLGLRPGVNGVRPTGAGVARMGLAAALHEPVHGVEQNTNFSLKAVCEVYMGASGRRAFGLVSHASRASVSGTGAVRESGPGPECRWRRRWPDR